MRKMCARAIAQYLRTCIVQLSAQGNHALAGMEIKMVDIFAEAEAMARKAADEHDAWAASPAGQAERAARIADDIRRGVRDADGLFVEGPEISDDENDDENDCDCADKVPADLAPGDFWTCPICDAQWSGDDQ